MGKKIIRTTTKGNTNVFLQRADRNKHKLKELPALHEEAIEKIDCLECANCCKHFSPRFKTPDVKRISQDDNM